MVQRIVYQVLNKSGNPASGGVADDLAMFPSRKEAKKWVHYLMCDLGLDEKFIIRLISIDDYKIGEDDEDRSGVPYLYADLRR